MLNDSSESSDFLKLTVRNNNCAKNLGLLMLKGES